MTNQCENGEVSHFQVRDWDGLPATVTSKVKLGRGAGGQCCRKAFQEDRAAHVNGPGSQSRQSRASGWLLGLHRAVGLDQIQKGNPWLAESTPRLTSPGSRPFPNSCRDLVGWRVLRPPHSRNRRHVTQEESHLPTSYQLLLTDNYLHLYICLPTWNGHSIQGQLLSLLPW